MVNILLTFAFYIYPDVYNPPRVKKTIIMPQTGGVIYGKLEWKKFARVDRQCSLSEQVVFVSGHRMLIPKLGLGLSITLKKVIRKAQINASQIC